MVVHRKYGQIKPLLENGGEFILRYEEVLEHARRTGYLQRLRVIHPYLLIQTLITHRTVHAKITVRELWQAYVKMASPDVKDPHQVISYQSFYNRFSKRLPDFIREILISTMTRIEHTSRLKLVGKYVKFKAIYLKDNTIIRLHDKLASKFPATRTRKAGLAAGFKLSILFNVVAHGPSSVSLVPERTGDIRTLKIGPWVKDRLLILDLGFFKHWSFTKISENGGYFLTRLKSTSKPVVKRILTPGIDGSCSTYIGKPVNEVLRHMPRGTVVMEVTLPFRRRKYKTNAGKIDSIDFLVIAEYNPDSGQWHTYLTNLPFEEFTAQEICALYAFRWTIELLFKEMKGDNELGAVKSVNVPLNEAFVYISILRTVVSRAIFLLAATLQNVSEKVPFRPLLWSRIFKEHASEIARIQKKEHSEGIWCNKEWSDLIRILAGFSIPIKRTPSRMIQPAIL